MENTQSYLQVVLVEDRDDGGNGNHEEAIPPGISVAEFDYSVENHLKVMDKILKLSGESEFDYDQSEIQRISSSVTFLREWRHFCYKPQAIRFSSERETPQTKDVTGGINLTQFSSAAVPKDTSDGNKVSSHLSKDYVMYVGGLIWALDWCPRVHQRPDSDVNLEFIAIAAHPPDSSYHKIGAQLSGRGVIQIWALLNPNVKDDNMVSQIKKKSKKNSSNNKPTKVDESQPKRKRGRPRKNPINESVQFPEDSTNLHHTDDNFQNTPEQVAMEDTGVISFDLFKPTRSVRKKKPKVSDDYLYEDVQPLSFKLPEIIPDENNSKTEKDSSKKQKGVDERFYKKVVLTSSKSTLTQCELRVESQDPMSSGAEKANPVPSETEDVGLPMLTFSKSNLKKCTLRSKSKGTSVEHCDTPSSSGHDPVRLGAGEANYGPHVSEEKSGYISEDVGLPRLVMCLAHNGKVAWDVKWRPLDSCVVSKYRMGYLGVLLGNGALEVWEVPHPGATEAIFSACQKEGIDPRFMKLEPVFRCSILKCGDRQSIPLTMEWSTSSPHDLILAGCHDGVVALWKFSADGPLKDTRPLLCFSADTVPIRALAWAPVVSDPESANIIVTAGHKGVKFWDIRDPFRPLWDVNPVQRTIYGLDWLPDPRCVVLSFDDGEIRIISLSKAACDVPVTGTPFVGTQQQGLHSYYCSSSSIWNVQVSRLTGMVAYCCSDGTVLRFQLTIKAVEKDPRRNRESHYLCGSLTLQGSDVTVFSPLPNIPFPMKKSSNEWGDTPRSRRGYLSISNQEKRAKDQMLRSSQTPEQQDQPLALCYGDDPGSDDTSAAQKSKPTSETKPNNNKNPKTDKTKKSLKFTDEVPDNVNNNNMKDNIVNENEKQAFPPKIVAIHRVRWNMNKGSERWLCYGGAAGIVRCQEIN